MPEQMAESKLSTEEQVRTIWSLGGLTAKQLAKKVIQGINDDFLLDRAAALGFNFILALFPFLVFLLAVFGLFASHARDLQTNLLNHLSQVLPPAAFTVISHTLTEISRNSGGGKLTVGIALTLWFASGGMASMISSLDGAYEVKESRSWFKVRAIALGLTTAISILVFVALAAVLAGGYVSNSVASHYGWGQMVVVSWRLAQFIVGL